MNDVTLMAEWASSENTSSRHAESLLQQRPWAILPFGSYEQHGPHASLMCDSMIADGLATLVAKEVSCLKLPVQTYGVSVLHRDFPGSIWLPEDVIRQLLFGIGLSLVHHGVKALWVLNGHGGNIPALKHGIDELTNTIRVEMVNWWEVSRERWPEQFSFDERHHAGAEETSLLMTLYPKAVDPKLFADTRVTPYSPTDVANVAELTPTGVIGKVSSSSRDRGSNLLALLIPVLVEMSLRFFCADERGAP